MTEGLYGSIILGKVANRIMTFHEIQREYKGRYGAHMVHLRKPLLEWAGNDLIKIDMRIKLNTAWVGDSIQGLLDEWHQYHEGGIAAPLIIGGRPMAPDHSLFVISDMKEHHKHWLQGGRLIAVELDIRFEEYIPYEETAGVSFTGGIPGFNTGALAAVAAIAGPAAPVFVPPGG